MVKESVYKRIIILGIILRLGILVGSYFDLVPGLKITNSYCMVSPISPLAGSEESREANWCGVACQGGMGTLCTE